MTGEGRHWHDRPLRIIQTVLRLPDIVGYDARAVVDYVHHMHGNVLVVNGGGLWAFYPSKVPGHHRAPGMAGDILRDLRDLTAKEGIRLLVRVDFRAGHQDMFEAHPDWFSYDISGQPLMLNDLYAATPLSPFRNEGYGFKIVREILEHYEVDGIWENAPSFGPLAHGPVVERRFKDETGYTLPRQESEDDPAYLAWREWRYQCVRRHSEDLLQVIKSFGDDKAYVAEGPAGLDHGWVSRSAMDLEQLGPLWDIVSAPTFDLLRGSYGSGLWPTPVWRSEEATKYLRATAPGKPATILFGPFDNASRYSSVVTQELRLWLAGVLANGGGFWDCTFVGTHGAEFLDQRGQPDIAEFYELLEHNEELFDEVEPVADVAVVHSRRAEEAFGSNDPREDGYIQHVRGFELALFENHIPFDILPEARISRDTLARYQVVILPNAALLPDDQQAALRDYVRAGGGVVASYETSLRGPDLRARDEYGLADVFGVRSLGVRYGPMQFAYSAIRRRAELTAGLEETRICTNRGDVWLVEADGADVPVALVPRVVPQPPERGWVPAVIDRPEAGSGDELGSGRPVVAAHSFGDGRSVLFPGQTDKLFASDGHPDYGVLLRNAVRWAAGSTEGLLETDAPAAVHLSVTRHRTGRLMVHLVNYCGGYRRPITATQRVQDVSVLLRCDRVPTAARLLRGGGDVPLTKEDGAVRFVVPAVDDYEAVVLE